MPNFLNYFKEVLNKADEYYEDAKKSAQTKDSDGFTRLVRWATISDAIENLLKAQGSLEIAIKMLKNSPELPKYRNKYDKITDLLMDLRKRQEVCIGDYIA